MKIRICDENTEAEKLLPPAQPDKSGVGVNYVEAYLKPLNTTLPDGRKLAVKRKGLKITVTLGTAAGDALLRKREHGPDPRRILREALTVATRAAGAELTVEDHGIHLAFP